MSFFVVIIVLQFLKTGKIRYSGTRHKTDRIYICFDRFSSFFLFFVLFYMFSLTNNLKNHVRRLNDESFRQRDKIENIPFREQNARLMLLSVSAQKSIEIRLLSLSLSLLALSSSLLSSQIEAFFLFFIFRFSIKNMNICILSRV